MLRRTGHLSRVFGAPVIKKNMGVKAPINRGVGTHRTPCKSLAGNELLLSGPVQQAANYWRRAFAFRVSSLRLQVQISRVASTHGGRSSERGAIGPFSTSQRQVSSCERTRGGVLPPLHVLQCTLFFSVCQEGRIGKKGTGNRGRRTAGD